MIEPGTVLQDRYLIEKQIGQGGMGTVYLACDQRFNSPVAIKETLFETDEQLHRAFEREAQLLNNLRHPALPRVSDFFAEEGGEFLVMEYIAGEDLFEMQKTQGKFVTADVLRWTDELLDALDFLHTRTPPVVHRDIKPQNLKLTERNSIILLDFGLAKGKTGDTSKLSLAPSLFGYSRSYSPIEQIQGTGTDPRSDLYSLAATIYHLLTGKTPLDALARATAVLDNQPDPLAPVHELNREVPPAVAEVLQTALSLNAGARFETAAAMREALQAAVGRNKNAAVAPVVADAEEKTVIPAVNAANAALLAAEPEAVAPAGEDSNPIKVDIAPAPVAAAPKKRFIRRHVERVAPESSGAKVFSGAAAAVILVGGALAAGWYATSGAPADNRNSNSVQSVSTVANSNNRKADAKVENTNSTAPTNTTIFQASESRETAPTTAGKPVVNTALPAAPEQTAETVQREPAPEVEKPATPEPIVVESAPPTAEGNSNKNKKREPVEIKDDDDAPPPAKKREDTDDPPRPRRRSNDNTEENVGETRERRVPEARRGTRRPTLLGAQPENR